METPPPGAVAVIFLSARTPHDAAGYAAAAAAMEAAAVRRAGCLGIDSARDAGGVGITISWWRSEADAIGWRDDPEHARIREQGRDRWYDWYKVVVATVDRAYAWMRREEEISPSPRAA